jgi:signal recognition particle GTPase
MLIEKYKIENKSQIFFNKKLYYNLLNYEENEKNVNDIEFLEKHDHNNFIKNYKKFYKKKMNEKFEKFKKLPNLLIHGTNGSGKKTLLIS